ncbi:plasmid stabilization system [Alcanivorax sp. S71-1-4]|uniref:type II toxin-antitoxin system RelE/ParE family toxin n=1 Tax=Alcanivorax sp. S71-1-4 TaxID=1177159 RepID=UPI001356AA88|nr:type II toxin-antitoxin system RelE/ParE family toxin [Alcanivorax sp. S71-1-4]KAF0809843.1 plasmid stabilization system [Alcanivorax sp. S71-1-4]
MAFYKLTEEAAEDLASIYYFGVVNFGSTLADTYVDGLEKRFEQIGRAPELYPAIEHVMAGYRLSVYRRHSIYFRLT